MYRRRIYSVCTTKALGRIPLYCYQIDVFSTCLSEKKGGHQHENVSSESSASPRDLSPLVSRMCPIVTAPSSPTTNQNKQDAALSSPDDYMQGPDLAGDPEQLDYPGEEEIMRIYKARSIPPSGYD